MVECKNDQCELKKEIAAIRSASEDFQRSTSTTLKEFKDEMRRVIKDVDDRHTKSEQHLETELRSDIQRGQMMVESKVNSFIGDTNGHLLNISTDLGEIKGALGLKANKDETGKLRSSVMNRLELQRKEAADQFSSMRRQQYKFSHKVLFTIIGLMASGLFMLAGYFIGN